MSEISRQGAPYRSTPSRGFPPAELAARYRPIAIRAVVAALEASRRTQPAPEALARVWRGREFD
jgi:hypothetical protein